MAIWSLIPLPFLNPAWTSGGSWFMYCWSLAWRILSITLLACEISPIVWWFEHSLALPFIALGVVLKVQKNCIDLLTIGAHREMKSDITVSEKSVWLTHHIERVEYICSICIEAKALCVSQSSFFLPPNDEDSGNVYFCFLDFRDKLSRWNPLGNSKT